MKRLKPINSAQYQAQLRHAGAVMQRYHAKIIAAGCMVHGEMVYIPKCFAPGTLERLWDEAVSEEASATTQCKDWPSCACGRGGPDHCGGTQDASR